MAVKIKVHDSALLVNEAPLDRPMSDVFYQVIQDGSAMITRALNRFPGLDGSIRLAFLGNIDDVLTPQGQLYLERNSSHYNLVEATHLKSYAKNLWDVILAVHLRPCVKWVDAGELEEGVYLYAEL